MRSKIPRQYFRFPNLSKKLNYHHRLQNISGHNISNTSVQCSGIYLMRSVGVQRYGTAVNVLLLSVHYTDALHCNVSTSIHWRSCDEPIWPNPIVQWHLAICNTHTLSHYYNKTVPTLTNNTVHT